MIPATRWRRAAGGAVVAADLVLVLLGGAVLPGFVPYAVVLLAGATFWGLLRPGGLLMNHGITSGGVDNAQLGAGMGDFIERYIFPGGELLHVSIVQRDMALAGLEMVDTENLRPHYAKTLWAWSDALEAQLGEASRILNAQYGEDKGGKALRAYRLYLAGSAMGFERGWIALHQMLAVVPNGSVTTGSIRGAQSQYPFKRDYMYR